MISTSHYGVTESCYNYCWDARIAFSKITLTSNDPCIYDELIYVFPYLSDLLYALSSKSLDFEIAKDNIIFLD